MKVYLYPSGKMVISAAERHEIETIRPLIQQLQEAWDSGKAVVLGKDVEVVLVQPDISDRLDRIEKALGIA